MKLDRVFDIIDFQIEQHATLNAYNIKIDSQWRSWSSMEIRQEIYGLAQGLLNSGLQKGDRIVMVPKAATAQMLFLDLAAQLIGVVPVFAHGTFSISQFNHIVGEARPRYLFFSTEKLAIHFCSGKKGEVRHYITLLDDGSIFRKEFRAQDLDLDFIKEESSKITPEDLSVIIYTSGSTGTPKGVMLTHRNIMSNLGSLMPLLPLKPGCEVLSYLPYSHVLERSAIYAYLVLGMKIYVVDDINTLSSAFREVKPYFISAVPSIIEKILQGLEKFRAQRGWPRKQMLGLAIKIGMNHQPHEKWRVLHRAYLFFARYFIFRKLRMALGGRLQGIVVGGAHLRPELGHILEVAGITVREGYGMTETAPIITINRFEPGLHRMGTVGLPLPNVEIKIDKAQNDSGEILVNGPNVTQGYYRRPDLTTDLFDEDGWLKTGDVGRIDAQGFLTITDRKKDIIKTSAGKYIAPAIIENLLKSSPFIHQVMVVGFQKPFLTALIVPRFELLEAWCHDHKIHWTSPKYMVHNIKVKGKMSEEITAVNGSLPKFKRIREFTLLPIDWTPENGTMSASYKPLRKEIARKYAKEIEQMYR